MKPGIFLSYAREQEETARRIEISLKGEGYDVFRDRPSLPPGEAYDVLIRDAIRECDLFVFLISPASVAGGRYTLTELEFAEKKWGHAGGRVLPVYVEDIPKGAIPEFLSRVTILRPRGNLVAEVAAEVHRMTKPWYLRMLEPKRLVPAVILLLAVGSAWIWLPPYLERRQQDAEAMALVEQSRSQAKAGRYADAWKLLEQANAVAPASRAVFEAQEQFAMEELRRAGLSYRRGTAGYENVVKTMLPVLARGTSGAKGERLANLRAHMGWADYLRGGMAGVRGMDPLDHYRAALEADPTNVYAHAMWGFELLRKRRSPEALAEAKRYFSAALESGREREYVRTVEVSGLLQTYTNVWIEDLERQNEVIRVVNAMRTGNETQPKGWGPGAFKSKVWSIYYFGFVTGNERVPLLGALPPAEHLATFRWLFPEQDLPKDESSFYFHYLYVLAQLQEHGGDRAGALASYQSLLKEQERRKFDASNMLKIVDEANAAIKRLAS